MDSNRKEEYPQRDDTQYSKQKIDAEAVSQGTTPERVTGQTVESMPVEHSTAPVGQMGHDQLKDGYSENQGGEYDQTNPGPDQEGYDPTHSGVRHAQRKPGTTVNAPGREEGTAWAEHRQMGSTTDTERKNPAD